MPRHDGKVYILYYHKIIDSKENRFDYFGLDIPVKSFRKQMQYLSQRCNPISLNYFISCATRGLKLPPKSIIVTLDDGYKDSYTNAYPILQQYKIPATIFLTTDPIDCRDTFWWEKLGEAINRTSEKVLEINIDRLRKFDLSRTVKKIEAVRMVFSLLNQVREIRKKPTLHHLFEKLKIDENELKMNSTLSWEEIREMGRKGIEFGAHTLTHPILTKTSPEQAEKEIIKSKLKIEEKIGKAVNSFSYPQGDPSTYNESLKKFLKNSGFSCACTTIQGVNNIGSDLYELKRIYIDPQDNLLNFKDRINERSRKFKRRNLFNKIGRILKKVKSP